MPGALRRRWSSSAAQLVEPSNGFRGSVPSFRVVAMCTVLTRSAFLGDAVRVGPLHVRDGVIRLMTKKTGGRVSLDVSDALVGAIRAWPIGDMTFIVGDGGSLSSKKRPPTCSAFGRRRPASTSPHTVCESGATVAFGGAADERENENSRTRCKKCGTEY
jgi:hypothetical protein